MCILLEYSSKIKIVTNVSYCSSTITSSYCNKGHRPASACPVGPPPPPTLSHFHKQPTRPTDLKPLHQQRISICFPLKSEVLDIIMSHDPTQEFNESAWDTTPEAAAAAAAAGEYLDMGAAFCLSTRTYCHYTRKYYIIHAFKVLNLHVCHTN